MTAHDNNDPVLGLPQELGRDTVIIGSDRRNARVMIPGAESVHAVITCARSGFEDFCWWIEDKSASGTLLNGERLEGKVRLVDGDGIVIAGANIFFQNGWLREDHRSSTGVRVDVRGLTVVRGGDTILDSVSFTVKEGEFLGILGPSGCGKSSVIQRIAGLAGFTSGSITINGHPVSGCNKVLRQLVAYLPQNVEDSLHDDLTPLEELACARSIYLAPNAEGESSDSDTLDELGLAKAANTRIGNLSGGEKRRVAIALALLRDPQLLIFDEPTAGLDPATETDVMRRLQHLARQGRTVICATHVMENISLCTNVLALSGGKANKGMPVYFGSPDKIRDSFGVRTYPELYRKLMDMPSDAAVRDDTAVSEQWDLPEPPRKASFLRSVVGYAQRSFAEFKAALSNPRSKLDRFIPAPLRTLLIHPILLALGIKCACAKMLCGDEAKIVSESCCGVSTGLFCAALAVFWLGLVGNVQGLVRERIPRRCLERLGGISLFRYGVARLIAVICPCLIQTAVFAFWLFALPEFGQTKESCLQPSSAVAGVLFLVCLMGGLIGTAVSACARNTIGAVGFVPLLAAFALFFSQPVIGFSMSDRSKYGVAERIAEWTPCYRPQLYMTALEDVHVLEDEKTEGGVKKYPKEEKTAGDFFFLFGVYFVVAIGVALLGQGYNERRWEGR